MRESRNEVLGIDILTTTAKTDENVDVNQDVTTPAIGMIALKFVASLVVIVALFALAWSR